MWLDGLSWLRGGVFDGLLPFQGGVAGRVGWQGKRMMLSDDGEVVYGVVWCSRRDRRMRGRLVMVVVGPL